MVSSYEIMMTTSDGATEVVDLTEAGNVYGKLEQCRTETDNCAVKSVTIGGDGFEGTYGVPEAVENIVERRRRLGHSVSD